MAARKRSWLDWTRVGLAAGAVLLVFVLGARGSLRICEQQALQSGRIVQVCRGPTASDLVVVAGGVLVILLLAKEFQEIGLFGFSLKSRVEEQEQRTGRLEQAVLDMKVEARASAAATTNVFLASPDQVRQLTDGTANKEQEWVQEIGPSPGDED